MPGDVGLTDSVSERSTLLIRGGRLHDGRDWVGERDVRVERGRVTAVSMNGRGAGTVGENVLELDASGLVVCPGFVDVHNMTRTPEELDGADAINLLSQGVTTTIVGNCGMSGTYSTADDVAERCRAFGRQRLPVNAGFLVGHNSVRELVQRELGVHGPFELPARRRLRDVICDALNEGALGVSLGLMYEPGWHADAAELQDLADCVAQADAILAVHVRDEGPAVLAAIDEAIALSRTCRTVILHVKVCGPSNRSQFEAVTEHIATACSDGNDLHVTFYPYTATNTALSALVPPRIRDRYTDSALSFAPADELVVEAEGLQTLSAHGWAGVVLTSQVPQGLVGVSIGTLALREECTPYQALVDLLASHPRARAMFRDVVDEAQLRDTASWPNAVPASDGYVFSSGECLAEHPRNYGAIVRSIEWERERIGDVGRAIRQLTSVPAQIYRLPAPSVLAVGEPADIAIVSPGDLTAPADFSRPCELAQGVVATILGGDVVFQDGKVSSRGGGRAVMGGRRG